jgi:isocitrate/isopropylmalate dehydrogenase
VSSNLTTSATRYIPVSAIQCTAVRKLLTLIIKSNAQRHAMVMWDEIALQISKEFPDVTWDKELVDASTARMINRPASLDTIVATNLAQQLQQHDRHTPADHTR